jgi:capsular exopolysaccharide synthesis family protein
MRHDTVQTPKEINITDLLHSLWRRKKLVGAITTVMLLLALLAHVTATPEYRPSSIVLIKADKGKSSARELLDPFGSLTGVAIENDIELIQSYPLAEAAVRHLFYSNDRDSLELFGHRPYISPLYRPLKLAFATLGSKKDSLTDEEQIRAFATALQKRVRVSNSRDTDVLDVSVSSPFADEAALLTNTLCTAYLRKDVEWNADQAQQVKGFVSEQIAEQQAEIKNVDARLSAYMKNKNIYELTGNAENLLEKLVDAESRYNDARSEYNILNKRREFIARKLSEEEKAFTAKVARNLNQQAQDINARIRQEEVGAIGRTGESGTKNPQVAMLKQRLQELTRNVMAGELAFSNKARQFRFDLISEQLQTDIRLAELDYIAQEYQHSRDYYNTQLEKLPQKQLEYARLQRDREVLNNTYTLLKKKLEESRIQIASEVGKVVIVGVAYPPVNPVAPSLRKNLLVGMLFAMIFGGGAVIFFESRDTTLRGDSFIDDIGYIQLASIPYVRSQDALALPDALKKSLVALTSLIPGLTANGKEKLNGNGASNGKGTTDNGKEAGNGTSKGAISAASREKEPILMSGQLASHFAESFRDLRTNIIFSRADRNLKSILVTGTEVSEGKSTVSVNLAYSFALLGRRTLLVDCDLRRPSIHQFVKAFRSPGLSEYLAGLYEDAAQLIKPSGLHENLSVLTAGRTSPNPNELIGSHKMAALLQQLSSQWDMVVIDSPPALMLSDAALLSQSVDGILMVAQIGYTNKHFLKEARKVDYLNRNLLGIAVIGPKDQNRDYDKYTGYYRRHYYRVHDSDASPVEQENIGIPS